jgi:hypothetical protein
MAQSVWALSNALMVEHMNATGESNPKQWLFHSLDTLLHDQFSGMTVTL